MNKKRMIQLFLIMMLLLTSCKGNKEETNVNNKETFSPLENGENVLIAYFSKMENSSKEEGLDALTSPSATTGGNPMDGNVQLLAQTAKDITGGQLFSIQTVEKYPVSYEETSNQAREEQKSGSRPELASHLENMDDYDIVILVYPNWWGTLPQAVFTFLEEYDFSDKTILPLCTHEGSGVGNSIKDITSLSPHSILSKELAVKGSSTLESQEQVKEWLTELGFSE
ncbi:flavodoxin [bacterium 1XD42-8]|nr:flavodoxin [bacterium 1XD42-8]